MEGISKSFWCPHESDLDPEDKRWRMLYMQATVCQDCTQSIKNDSLRTYCKICYSPFHIGCVPNSPGDINHPSHPYHPLKLLVDGPPDYSNGKCNACHEELKRFVYHCSICDFNMHARCSKNPPPPILDVPRCHEHTLTLMARNDRFTCNACGSHGEQCPYVCAPCALMFHRDCTILPHVININRHDHRVSHTYSLGFGDWKCPICHKKIDWRYGAYSCSTCTNYVVHSKCATREDVWDGEELEGVPEEFVDLSPFIEIEDGVINHFSHKEHNLKLIEDAIELDRRIRCEACNHPIFSEKHYRCMECRFILHETCANFPRQKRHGLCTKPLALISTKEDINEKFYRCDACGMLSNGFRYERGEISLDMRCVSISSYCDYECHPHPLFLTTTVRGTCGACHEERDYVLNCVECVFSLCFKCATLPNKIKHRCDDHFLVLCFREEAKGKYWCEVCETVLDPENWFYKCDSCLVVCHIGCVLGEFPNAKPGVIRGDTEEIVELVSNDSMSRPKCSSCGSHCQRPLLVKWFYRGNGGEVICKTECASNN